MACDKTITEERVVLCHIKELLDTGRLQPGDRLPSERKLAERFSVSRAHVRSAFQTLESYGIVKTYPQSGTEISDYKLSVLQSLMDNKLEVDTFDFYSLVYVRVLLEAEAIRLCATNRSGEDIKVMQGALDEFAQSLSTESQDERDFAFHLSIARASHNPVISSLLLLISPDVLKYYRAYKACTVPPTSVLQEHRDMLQCIIDQDPDAAEECLRHHFVPIKEFAEQFRVSIPRTRI